MSVVVKWWLENLIFCIGMLLVQQLAANEVFKPPFSYGIDQVPPFAANLSKDERERLEKEREKEIEQIVKRIVQCGDNQKDFSVKDPDKNSEHLSKELRELLYKQYRSPELEKKISLTIKKADICDAISLIGKSAGLSFIIDSQVKGVVQSINFNNISVASALRVLLENNKPQLALVKEYDIWRIIRLFDAKDLLFSQVEVLKEKEFEQKVFTFSHMKWNDAQKLQIEKMWQGITGDSFSKHGFYLSFNESNKKIFFRGKKDHVVQFTRLNA